MHCLSCIGYGFKRFACFFLSFITLSLYALDAFSCEPVEYPVGDFPYPSNVYSVYDEASPTGLRLNLCNTLASDDAINGVEAGALWWWPVQFEGDLFQQAIVPLKHHLTPEAISNNVSGFSPANAVIFSVRGLSEHHYSRLPQTAQSSVFAYDLTSGHQVPVTVSLDYFYEKSRPSATHMDRQIIRVEPRSKWESEHEYVVFFTEKINEDVKVLQFWPFWDVGNIVRSAQYQDAVSDRNETLSSLYGKADVFLNDAGFDTDDILDMTVFTVRNQAEIVSPMAQAIQAVSELSNLPRLEFSDDAQWLANPEQYPNMSRVAGARIALPNYLTVTGDIRLPKDVVEANEIPFWEDVEVKLWLPDITASYGTSVATVIYVHGVGGSRESAYLTKTAQYNAQQGIATLAFDLPGQGDRSDLVGSVDTFAMQTVLNLAGLIRSLELSVSNMHETQSPLYNSPVIDIERLSLVTTSLGTAYAGVYGAIGPGIKGAYFQVGGGKAAHVWNYQANTLNFDSILHTNEFSDPYRAVRMNEIQQLRFDYMDVINYAEYFSQPLLGAGLSVEARPLGMLNAAGGQDQMVPTHASRALAEVARLSQYNASLSGVHPRAAKQAHITALENNTYRHGYVYTEVDATGCNIFGLNCDGNIVGHGIHSHNFYPHDNGHAARRQWLRDMELCQVGVALCDADWDSEANYIVH
ncbi:MAG: hypothetical protein K6L80_08750 [Agarilytica sp.]